MPVEVQKSMVHDKYQVKKGNWNIQESMRENEK